MRGTKDMFLRERGLKKSRDWNLFHNWRSLYTQKRTREFALGENSPKICVPGVLGTLLSEGA